MLGQVISVEETSLKLKLSEESKSQSNLINKNIIIEDEKVKIVGEILDVEGEVATVDLVGEFLDGAFLAGVIKKPSFQSNVRLITTEELSEIIGKEDFKDKTRLYIGRSPLYEGAGIFVPTNELLSNHFAILGNTGSGKSCSVARIVQNIFYNPNFSPRNANLLIFDAYGEYQTAFSNMNQALSNVVYKSYTTDIRTIMDARFELLKIPPWLLSVDDYALLLNATDHTQIPIIEKALKLVGIFTREEADVLKLKNDIIARALQEILYSGKAPAQIRDQIFAVLTRYNTSELSLETKIVQPGYIRTLKQCFNIDDSGKIHEIQLISEFLQGFLQENVELALPDGSFKYNLADLESAFDFALISEGVLKSDRVYDQTNILRVRLHALINDDYREYFEVEEYITREDFIRSLLLTKEGRKAQIVNFNINYVDDRFAKVITKIFSKLVFDYATNLEPRASFPIHILLEEAHRYVQNDIDTELLGYNIFDRITKEGRKYGVIIGLISQRPSELSETAISQCSNFLIFRMLHPRDLQYIKEMLPNITAESVKKLKILQPGMCVAFGSAFKLPLIIKMDLPNPKPYSNNTDVVGAWYKEEVKMAAPGVRDITPQTQDTP